MTIPRNMPSEYVFDKEKLLDTLSIENWIMPACFAGHFSQLVWLKPPWAEQIKKGNYQFVIGDYCGNIKVNSTLEYFLSEGSYRPECDLSENKLVDLKVRTLTTDLIGHSELLPASNAVYILDIDLDFFSTHNPFLKIYEKAEAYQKLKKIFAFSWPEQLAQTDEILAKAKDRESQLDELEKVFKYVSENGSLEGLEVAQRLEPIWCQLTDLIDDILSNYNDVNWTLVYDAGDCFNVFVNLFINIIKI